MTLLGKYIFPILILSGLFAFIAYIIDTAGGLFSASSDNVKVDSITAIVSVSIFTLGRYLEQWKEVKQRLIVEKIAVYKRFLIFILRFLATKKYTA